MTKAAHVRPVDDDGPGVLERFLSDVAIDEYADAPERRSLTDVGARRPSTWIGLVVAAVVGLIIIAALLNTRLSSDERQQTRSLLSERVQSLSDSVAERQAGVDQLATDVRSLQDRLLAASDSGPARAAAISTLSAQAATSELSGPGVVVTIDDAPDAQAGSLNRVLDRDLQDIVNAMWRDGATGIAINEQRLTGSTAIRAAGEAILVNYQPLNRPYVITSVGGTSSVNEDSGVRGLLDGLSDDYGLVAEIHASDVALPAGELRSPRFATTAGGGAAQ